MKKLISLFLTIAAFNVPLQADIVKTVQIEDVVAGSRSEQPCLFQYCRSFDGHRIELREPGLAQVYPHQG